MLLQIKNMKTDMRNSVEGLEYKVKVVFQIRVKTVGDIKC